MKEQLHSIVFYHGNCFDGSMAAAAAQHATTTGGLPEETTILPIGYMDDIFAPGGLLEKANPGDDASIIYFLDFCPKAEVIKKLIESGDEVVVLDHHESAMKDVEALKGLEGLHLEFDMTRSGARMAWDYFHKDKSYPIFNGGHMPILALHVEDRDLWKFKLEGTREAIAWLSVTAKTNDPQGYLIASVIFQKDPERNLEIGDYIRKEMAVQITTMASRWRSVAIPGYPTGAIVNASVYQSEVGEAVYEAVEVPYVVVYAITKDGRVSLSFRSKQGAAYSARVNDIAKLFDGGGHPNAAGGVTSLETLNELLLSSKAQKSSNFVAIRPSCSC